MCIANVISLLIFDLSFLHIYAANFLIIFPKARQSDKLQGFTECVRTWAKHYYEERTIKLQDLRKQNISIDIALK